MNKNLYLLFIGILFICFACSPTPTYYGKWRCDRTGTVHQSDKPIQPITEVYDLFEIEYMQFEILEDGNFVFYVVGNSQSTTNDTAVAIPYNIIEDDGNEITLIASKDGKTETFILRNIKTNTMEVDMDVDNDGDFFLKMNMNRINE